MKIAAEGALWIATFAAILAAERYAGATGVMSVIATMIAAIALRGLIFRLRAG
jgi:hypothetical protein